MPQNAHKYFAFLKVCTVKGKRYTLSIIFFQKILWNKFGLIILKYIKFSDTDKTIRTLHLSCIKIFLKVIPGRLQMFEEISPKETWEIAAEKKKNTSKRPRCCHVKLSTIKVKVNNNTNVIARMSPILLENFMNKSHRRNKTGFFYFILLCIMYMYSSNSREPP